MLQIKREELAWAAGLFDGEGWSCSDRYNRKTGGVTAGCVLGVGQANRFVLDRFHSAIGFGSVTGPRKSRKTMMWQFKLYGFERVQAAMALLWVWLSPIKRDRLAEIMALAEIHRSKQKRRLFDPNQIIEIKKRLSLGEPQVSIAKKFGVPKQRIHWIASGRSYRSPEEIRNVAD